MSGLGYTPVMSSSAMQKTCILAALRDYCALF